MSIFETCQNHLGLKTALLETPLGPMIAVADVEALYALEFVDGRGLDEMEMLRERPGKTDPIHSIENELHRYFKGELSQFQTPVRMIGSAFQKTVWMELQKIPMGQTCSYLDVAKAMHKPSAVRAVGGANGANPLAIIVPCHRVIQANGELGGYNAGIARKKWLLSHESSRK